jgi:arylsulfatase A-like enzyme
VLHVPFLVRIPGRTGELVREPVGCFDFMPTLLGAANHSLDPLLVGRDYSRGPRPADRAQFARTRPLETRGVFEPKSLAVVLHGTKLLIDRPSGLRQYFDLRTDPEELQPLASVRPDVQRALGEAMDVWLSELARQSIPDDRTASAKR